jgi:hypothetical protein
MLFAAAHIGNAAVSAVVLLYAALSAYVHTISADTREKR